MGFAACRSPSKDARPDDTAERVVFTVMETENFPVPFSLLVFIERVTGEVPRDIWVQFETTGTPHGVEGVFGRDTQSGGPTEPFEQYVSMCLKELRTTFSHCRPARSARRGTSEVVVLVWGPYPPYKVPPVTNPRL